MWWLKLLLLVTSVTLAGTDDVATQLPWQGTTTTLYDPQAEAKVSHHWSIVPSKLRFFILL